MAADSSWLPFREKERACGQWTDERYSRVASQCDMNRERSENTMSLSCKNCGVSNYVKNGFAHGNQRYLCKTCGYRFTDTPGHGYPVDMRYNAAILYLCGLSISCSAFLLGVAPSTVQVWLEWVATEHPPKAVPSGTVVVIELDEMW